MGSFLTFSIDEIKVFFIVVVNSDKNLHLEFHSTQSMTDFDYYNSLKLMDISVRR